MTPDEARMVYAPQIADYQAGLTCKQLAEKHGGKLMMWYFRLRRAGVPMKRKGPPKQTSSLRNLEILAKRQSGATLEEISTEYDMTRERVRQITKALGDTVGRKVSAERRKAETEASYQRTCGYCGKQFRAGRPRLGCSTYHTFLLTGVARPEHVHRDAIAARIQGRTWNWIGRNIYGFTGNPTAEAQIAVRRWAKRTNADISHLSGRKRAEAA